MLILLLLPAILMMPVMLVILTILTVMLMILMLPMLQTRPMVPTSRGAPCGEDKRKEAEELIEKFKKKVKGSDKPAKAKDMELFLSGEPEITGYLEKFQEPSVARP